jgi:hypothetical protein
LTWYWARLLSDSLIPARHSSSDAFQAHCVQPSCAATARLARFRSHETIVFARHAPAADNPVAGFILKCFDDLEPEVVDAREERGNPRAYGLASPKTVGFNGVALKDDVSDARIGALPHPL